MRFYLGKNIFFIVYFLAFLGVNMPVYGVPLSVGGAKMSFAPIVKEVGPAVINISTQKVVRKQVSPFANDPFFQMFFGNALPGFAQERVERSLGSGVIVRKSGLFVTNYHVIKGADKVNVLLADNREFEAHLVDADPQFDLAIMQIDTRGESLPFATFGDSNALQVGDLVLAIGNPFGVGQSVSMGIVSALGRSNISQSPMGDFIQTDAAINPGNSGGALVSSNGRVIGINSAIFTRSGGSDGIGFAIPANVVRAVVESVEATGKVQRAWFGAAGQDVNQVLADNLGLKRPVGVLINEIAPGSPADKSGLQIGDIILTLDAYDVPNAHALKSRIASTPVAQTVKIGIWRTGKERTLQVALTPPPQLRADQRLTLGRHPLKGYTVERITPYSAQELGLNLNATGVVVVQVPQRGIGLRVGDILEKINGVDLKDLNALKKILHRKPQKGWEIIYRRGQRVFRLRLR